MEPAIEFKSQILVEPILNPLGHHLLQWLREALVKSAYERRDVWPSRAHALANLKAKQRTSKWHPRVTELFVVCIYQRRNYDLMN